MRFKIALFFARLGFFKHHGLRNMGPLWYPRARVFYPQVGKCSGKMAIGNAVDYAKIFKDEGARVVPVDYKSN